MEREWELDRMRLYQVRRDHPEWTLPQLAEALARSLSWVKKWLKRFRETPHHLDKDELLKQQGVFVPRSPRVIWRILKAAGRIPTRIREHHPFERPEPMHHAGMPVGVLVDASQRVFHILRGAVLLAEKEIQGLIGQKMAFQDYLQHMLTEAQTSDSL